MDLKFSLAKRPRIFLTGETNISLLARLLARQSVPGGLAWLPKCIEKSFWMTTFAF